jgi:anti-sigma factor RsiW
MRCHEVQLLLADLIEDQVPPETGRQVRSHLKHCPICQREYRALRHVIAALQAFPIMAEPTDLTARVMAQIQPHQVLPGFRVRWIDVIASAVGAGLFFGMMLIPWRLWSASLWTEFSSVLAKAQLFQRLMALQLHQRWPLVADGVWMPAPSRWWLSLFVVAVGASAVMAVRERQALFRV